jgi:hypothetical protein
LLFEASKTPALAKAPCSDIKRHEQTISLSAIADECLLIGQMRHGGKVLVAAVSVPVV